MSLYDVCHVVFLSMGHPCTNQIFVLNFLVLVVGPPCISVVSVSDILVRSLSQTFISKSVSIRDINVLV